MRSALSSEPGTNSMAQIYSPRRALTNLPINTSAIHQPAILTKGDSASLKRMIHEVEDPEVQLAPTRPRTHLHTNGRETPKNRITEGMNNLVGKISSSNITKRPRLDIAADIIDGTGEGSSQHSSKDSISTSTDSDVGNETIASQETAQTDLTQPVESFAYLHAETLRLRLRVALFKVQTNQTNIPMSQLNISANDTHRSHETTPTSPPLQDEAAASKLLPALVLHPTTHSTRMILQEKLYHRCFGQVGTAL